MKIILLFFFSFFFIFHVTAQSVDTVSNDISQPAQYVSPQSSRIGDRTPKGRVILIETHPSALKLFVDNQYVGVSPLEIELSIGKHLIIAERGDQKESKYFFVARRGGAVNVKLTFSNNKTIKINETVVEMVAVKGGSFLMGCSDDQLNECEAIERPRHQVTVSDYYIGKTEVTLGLFSEFVKATGYITDAEKYLGSYFWSGYEWQLSTAVNWRHDHRGIERPSGDKDYPVVNVSWNDAIAFCKWMTEQTGYQFRLPTEAEWEYAARGGRKSNNTRYSGSQTIDNVAWFTGNSSFKINKVAQKEANELGIFDMSGNVWEWCSDWRGRYSSIELINPTGPIEGSNKIMRGGCWNDISGFCRVSCRGDRNPDFKHVTVGFRVVMEKQPK